MGVDINWVSFDTGTAMSAAMASGDVQICRSAKACRPSWWRPPPGRTCRSLDVAVAIPTTTIASWPPRWRSTRTAPANWRARRSPCRSAPPRITASSSRWTISGSIIATMQIVDMAPPEGAAAIAQGSVDMACGWGGALRRMKEYGNVLLTGAEKDELGHPRLRRDLRHPPPSWPRIRDLVAKFLKVTAEANAMWNGRGQPCRDAAGDRQGCGHGRGRDRRRRSRPSSFPPVEAQLSDKWLGGDAQNFMKGVADVFVEAGSIDGALDSYEDAVNTGPLEAAHADQGIADPGHQGRTDRADTSGLDHMTGDSMTGLAYRESFDALRPAERRVRCRR